MVYSRNHKTYLCACLIGLFLFLGGSPPARAYAAAHAILTRIVVNDTSKFVRLRFLFKGGAPHQSGAILNRKTLILLFPGARVGNLKKQLPGPNGLVKGIHVSGLPKGIKVKIHLKSPNVEYVKYQRRTPPQVVVSLRKARKTRVKKIEEVPHTKKGRPSLPVRPVKMKQSGGRAFVKKSVRGSTQRVPQKAEKKVTKVGKTERKEKAQEEKNKTAAIPEKPAISAKPVQSSHLLTSTLPPSKDPSVKALFNKAKKVWEAKDYTRAAKMFKEVLEKSPESKEGEESAFYWVKSEFFLEKKRKKKILKVTEDYEDILRKFPDAPWSLLALRDLGKQYTALSFYNQAIDAYQRIVEKFPGSPEEEKALIRIGKLQIEQQAFKAAEKTFRDYLKRFQQGKYSRDATYFLGDTLYYQGDIQRAVEVYQSAMKRWPRATSTDLKTLENMAALFERNGNTDRAFELLFMALNLFSSRKEGAELMYKIAELYKRQGKFREALKVYSRILAQYPGSHEAAQSVITMAELSKTHPGIKYKGFQYGIDPYEFPLRAYESILKGQKDPFVLKKALLGKGKFLLGEKPEKAIPVLLKLVQTYPNALEAGEARKLLNQAFYNLIVKDSRKKRFEGCIKIYKRYLRAGLEKNPPLIMQTVECYLRKGDLAPAEKTLRSIDRNSLRPEMRVFYDYDEAFLTLSKGDEKKTIALSLALLKRYPKAKKRMKVLALMQSALMGLEHKQLDSLIELSLKKLLANVHGMSEKKMAEKMLATHIKSLNVRDKEGHAITLLEWYLRTFPRFPGRYVFLRMLGDTCLQSGKFVLAEQAYLKSLKGKFNKVQQGYILYKVGFCLVRQKRYFKAREVFASAEKALSGIRESVSSEIAWLRRQIRLQLAELLFLEGKKGKAKTALQAFVKQAPKGEQKDWALYRLGELYRQQQDIKGVTGAYDTLGTQGSDPFWKRNAEDLKTTLGWFVQHAGEFKESQKETN